MSKFELKISPLDWLFIIIVAIIFSSVLSTIIFITLNSSWEHSLIVGAILGFCLAFISIALISVNNRYILPKINKTAIWWIISAILAFFAGYIGFYFAFFLVKSLYIPIPVGILSNIDILALFSGLLNYLMGLIIYLFVRMKTKKQEIETLFTEGRIFSLNTQLNSHFLFNVLNSIIELLRVDSNKAEEALIKLGRFFRKALNEDPIIKISEELDNVRTYVELENLRYNGLIQLNVVDEEKVAKILIPRFSIQLLVENAIKHGFTGKDLNIEILFKNLDSSVMIHVLNDGKKIENLNFGTGLTNLTKRLKVLCNGELEFIQKEKNEFIINLPK
ncbi:MAG: histidine kinase [Thermodesulfovibrio sp.]|nr:histidine kinase [Thermodesulfovibrio sp.]